MLEVEFFFWKRIGGLYSKFISLNEARTAEDDVFA